ncbi:MAG: hypothetical protein SOH48_04605 [Eubacteriales bacterium]
MSQKKVNEYKEYKKNRGKILKREKRMRRLEYLLIAAVCAVFVGWFGWSIYSNAKSSADAKEKAAAETVTSIDMSAYAEYVSGLQTSFSAS